MATITKNGLTGPRFGGVPYSDSYVRDFTLLTDSAGKIADSDTPGSAIAIADVVRLGVLPAGIELHAAIAAISDAFTAATTFKLGFAYTDGVDDTAVPQDDDYFILAGAASSAIAILGSSNVSVSRVTLPKDAYLILTNAGAAHASVGRADFIVFGKNKGVK